MKRPLPTQGEFMEFKYLLLLNIWLGWASMLLETLFNHSKNGMP
jgi:hypothetical protein